MALTNYNSRTAPTTSYRISLPFNISTQGKVATIEDSDHKIYQDQVITLLGVNNGERIWYENYGANIKSSLFDTGEEAANLLKKSIAEAFVRWLPKLTLIQSDTSFDSTTGQLAISVTYQTPDGTEDSVKIFTNSLTASGETTVSSYGR